MQFSIKWGDVETSMVRVRSKSSGHTYYDTYQIESGPEFSMYRDHFDARRLGGTRVLVVDGRDILVIPDNSTMSAQEIFGATRKIAEWDALGVQKG